MDRVKLKQFIILTFLVTIAMKLFILPALMMRICGRDSFVVLIIDGLAELILLFIVLQIMRKSSGENFFSLLKNLFGRVGSKIIACILAVFYLLKVFMAITDLRVFFTSTVFNTPMSPLHILPVVILLAFFAAAPLSSIGRVGELFIPWILLSMVLLGGLVLYKADFSGLFPILGEGWADVIAGLEAFPLWFGDFVILLVMTGKVDGGKKIYFSLISALIGLVAIVTFAAVLFSAYADMPEVLSYGHNISNMTQYSVGTFNIGRFDLIIFTVWVAGVLIAVALMKTLLLRSTDYIFGKKSRRIVLPIVCAILFAMLCAIQDLALITDYVILYLGIPAFCVQFGLPLVIWVTSLFHKRKPEAVLASDASEELGHGRSDNLYETGGGQE